MIPSLCGVMHTFSPKCSESSDRAFDLHFALHHAVLDGSLRCLKWKCAAPCPLRDENKFEGIWFTGSSAIIISSCTLKTQKADLSVISLPESLDHSGPCLDTSHGSLDIFRTFPALMGRLDHQLIAAHGPIFTCIRHIMMGLIWSWWWLLQVPEVWAEACKSEFHHQFLISHSSFPSPTISDLGEAACMSPCSIWALISLSSTFLHLYRLQAFQRCLRYRNLVWNFAFFTIKTLNRHQSTSRQI